MTKFEEITNEELTAIVGGKIYHNTPWQICNSKTHKCWADNGAIAKTLGKTIVNGWLQHGPWGAR